MNVPGWLTHCRWAPYRCSVSETEATVVPGTNDAVIFDASFIQGSPGMYAGGRQRFELAFMSGEHNRNIIGINPKELSFGYLIFGGDIDPLSDGLLKCGVIDSNAHSK